MKIAICDDCKLERQAVVELLHRHRPHWKISQFSCGEDLIDSIGDNQAFDLLFLDIYMQGINGMETAQTLRRRDCHTALVFLTTSRDFAVESYQVEALSYLVKPVEEAQLLAVIQRFETGHRPRQICLGNALKNAFEAASHSAQPFIHMTAYEKGDQIVFLMDNSFEGQLNPGYASTKDKDRGFGLTSIRSATEQSGGYLSLSHQDQIFTLKAVIPIYPPVQ